MKKARKSTCSSKKQRRMRAGSSEALPSSGAAGQPRPKRLRRLKGMQHEDVEGRTRNAAARGIRSGAARETRNAQRTEKRRQGRADKRAVKFYMSSKAEPSRGGKAQEPRRRNQNDLSMAQKHKDFVEQLRGSAPMTPRTAAKMRYGEHLTIATLNCQGLKEATKRHTIEQWMMQRRIDLAPSHISPLRATYCKA